MFGEIQADQHLSLKQQTTITLIPILFWAFALTTVCEPTAPPDTPRVGAVEIRIEPRVNGQPLALGGRLYRSPAGDSLYVDLLRFYISAVRLQGPDGSYSEPGSYHLIDAEEDDSQTIVLKNVPAGRYTTLSFLVGTDSLTNVSGALGGDLDPTKGMYWAWNSGYVNVKIEGRSDACPTRFHDFQFHIGGYMLLHATARAVVLPLKPAIISENTTTRIHVTADLERFFGKIKLAHTNSVMIPSGEAAMLADYFKDVFSSALSP